MPDFALKGTRKVGFKRSPFESFRERQRLSAGLLMAKKIILGMGFLGLSFILSVALISFIFLRAANWRQSDIFGVAFLTSPKGQVLKDTTILWIDPEKKEILFLNLPGDLTVHAPGSVAYSLKALYGLYALDHALPSDFRKALVRNTKIDTQFFTVREGEKQPSEMGLRMYTAKLLFSGSDPGLFPLADRFALFWYVWFGNAARTRVSLPDALVSSPDGLDSLDYDTFVTKHFLNVSLKKEAYSLAVVNASTQSRVASTVGRLFTAFGLNVLSVSDTPNQQGEGSIVVRDGRMLNSATVALLSRYVSGKAKVDERAANEYRSDIVVMLGKQDAKNFIP